MKPKIPGIEFDCLGVVKKGTAKGDDFGRHPQLISENVRFYSTPI
ncbi:hypothetical protein [Methanogenium organophilum]|uniref:Uncharacterized protein n=1 Tax=Methanogenium organophilum TaxID=2199 RepID=A0A9X9S3D2_METOG|nr:hypothetical protein [Methanogenium organophilum]WAI01007.1 hypothetical protein OU421_11385 [Methanogenium organophilum]